MNERLRLGATAEDLVARAMENRGYRLIGRNLRARKGELDIVCRNDKEIVVVEVRSRSSSDCTEEALESLSARKVQHVRRATSCFLATKPEDYEEVRFFAAIVTWDADTPNVQIIEDAF